MKVKKIVLLFTALYLIQILSVPQIQILFVPTVHANPDYELLIITPELFIEEVQPLKDFKDSTGRPTLVVTLENIYSDYPGDDEAEQVKRCIADMEASHNIKYVLLMGDVDKLPIRYFLVETLDEVDTQVLGEEIRWFAYYMTDQYYADLYDTDGDFCTWNADGDDYYVEVVREAPSKAIENVDQVDFRWDVVVGRVPASTETEVTNYVDKVIDYELGTFTTDAWFKNTVLVSGVGGSIYPDEPDYTDPSEGPPYYDLQVLDAFGDTMTSAGYTTTKLYHFGGDNLPDPATINAELNSGAGFLTIFSHQNQNTFGGGVYAFPTDMTGLANDGKLPIIFSLGCSPGKTGPIAPNEDYIDTSGVLQNYGLSYPQPSAGWTDPEPPHVIQSTTDQGAIPDYLLVQYADRGSIAFIGSMAEALPYVCQPSAETFHQSIADGETILGEVWGAVGDYMVSNYPVDSEWEYCRRWLFMNLFGDPSLRIGGLPDKGLPTTNIEVGPFNYDDGVTTYVKTPVDFTVTSDDPDFFTAYYVMYRTPNPHGIWKEGTSFTLPGTSEEVEYTIRVRGEDSNGNLEYPHNVKVVTVDTIPGTTTATIGSPKHEEGGVVMISSDSTFTLTQTDTGSGPNIIYYSIWDIPPSSREMESTPIVDDETYSGPFTIAGPDGYYYLEFRSYDNVYNLESTTMIELLLDNTDPDAQISIGDPKHLKDTMLWITSETPVEIQSLDRPSGVEHIEYTLTGTTVNNYIVTEGPFDYTGQFTLPKDNNNNEVEWLIEAEVTDKVGNTRSISQTVMVEDRPPYPWLTTDKSYYVYGETDYIYVSGSTNFWFEPRDWIGNNEGVGVDYTDFRIDTEALQPYTSGAVFSLTGPDGVHTIDGISVDLLGNVGPFLYTYYLDNTPPETSLDTDYPDYTWAGETWVTSATDITLEAEDDACGVTSTWYQVNGGGYNEYTGAFRLLGSDGAYLIEYYSIDYFDNLEIVKSETLVLDNSGPVVNIEQLEDGDYVYGYNFVPIEIIDDASGVEHVYISFDMGVTWTSIGYDMVSGIWMGVLDGDTFPDGSLTIMVKAEDQLGNVGFDDTPPSVTVVHLETSISFVDGEMDSLDGLDIAFRGSSRRNALKVVPIPGTLFEVITVTNTGTKATLPNIILDLVLPHDEGFLGEGREAFRVLGKPGVIIYLNDIDVTPDTIRPDLNNLDTGQAIAPGDTLEVYVHLEYSFKGERYRYDDVSSWMGETYLFETELISAFGPSWRCGFTCNPLL